MALPVDCMACVLGEHDAHNQYEGLKEGLIGGTYCLCTGDCAERAKQAFDEFMKLFEE